MKKTSQGVLFWFGTGYMLLGFALAVYIDHLGLLWKSPLRSMVGGWMLIGVGCIAVFLVRFVQEHIRWVRDIKEEMKKMDEQ